MESVAYRAVLRCVKFLNVALMTALAVGAWYFGYADRVWSQTGLLTGFITGGILLTNNLGVLVVTLGGLSHTRAGSEIVTGTLSKRGACQAEAQGQNQQQTNNLFHNNPSPFLQIRVPRLIT